MQWNLYEISPFCQFPSTLVVSATFENSMFCSCHLTVFLLTFTWHGITIKRQSIIEALCDYSSKKNLSQQILQKTSNISAYPHKTSSILESMYWFWSILNIYFLSICLGSSSQPFHEAKNPPGSATSASTVGLWPHQINIACIMSSSLKHMRLQLGLGDSWYSSYLIFFWLLHVDLVPSSVRKHCGPLMKYCSATKEIGIKLDALSWMWTPQNHDNWKTHGPSMALEMFYPVLI